MNRTFARRGILSLLLAAALSLVLLLPGNSFAASGGFSGPGPASISVKQAISLGDDDNVVLKGRIVRHLGGENYLFSDGTGEVTVEIDDDIWQGRSIGPSDTVEIHGEVDKDWNRVTIDVDRLIITTP